MLLYVRGFEVCMSNALEIPRGLQTCLASRSAAALAVLKCTHLSQTYVAIIVAHTQV